MQTFPSGASIRLQDSLSGETRSLQIEPGQTVSVYACGITPYSDAHIGHARSYVAYDVLARTLEQLGARPLVARNITDIDDKIIAAAAGAGVHWQSLSGGFAEKTRKLMSATGVRLPLEPKASEHLPEIFDLASKLIGLGYAYLAPNGDVYYRTRAYSGPALVGHNPSDLLSASGKGRVAAEGKEDPSDFALWKSMPPGQVAFESPFGPGRPGWHIECSAMISKLFGGQADIHGGGTDLKFPHHQCEIMQSEPVHQKPLAKIWTHNGSVLSDGVKMSKSLGNYVPWSLALDQAEQAAPGNGGTLLRAALLSAHWQKPMDWKPQILDGAMGLLRVIERAKILGADPAAVAHAKQTVAGDLALNLNVPMAFSRLRSAKRPADAAALGIALSEILHLPLGAPLPKSGPKDPSENPEAAKLQQEREKARANGDFALADELRRRLSEMGYATSDKKVPKAP